MQRVSMYAPDVPRLWNDTIEEHRRAVREATLDAAAALVAEHGVRGVTMQQIAERAGIGRATLYKYFPDIESILAAWHERHVHAHVAELAALAHAPGSAADRLSAVLTAYASIQHEHPGGELVALLHRGEHVAHADEHLRGMLRDLLKQAARAGDVRSDASPDELATYCLHALAAARALRSKPALRRLVQITIDGLRVR
jgi:AcrR family transcriptional regulator